MILTVLLLILEILQIFNKLIWFDQRTDCNFFVGTIWKIESDTEFHTTHTTFVLIKLGSTISLFIIITSNHAENQISTKLMIQTRDGRIFSNFSSFFFSKFSLWRFQWYAKSWWISYNLKAYNIFFSNF